MRSRNAVIIPLFCMLLLFSALQVSSYAFSDTDENVHMYLGKHVATGHLPYRDFFWGDPPLQALLSAAIYTAFGFSPIAFKIYATCAVMLCSLLIYAISRKLDVSAMGALLGSGAFLFSYSVLSNAGLFLGWETISLLMLGAVYGAITSRPVLAGTLLGLATLMKLYILPAAFAFLLWAAWNDRKNLLKMFLAWGAVGILPLLALFVAVGPTFLSQTIAYHLSKPSFGSGWEKLRVLIALNPVLFGGTILALRRPPHFGTRLVLLVAGLQTLAFTLWSAPYSQYALIILALLGILIGVMFDSYEWKAWLAALIITCTLLASGHHIEEYRGISSFSDAEEFAQHIRAGPPGDIFGYLGTTPLLALMTNRPLYGGIVELNAAIYQSGAVDERAFFSEMMKNPPAFIVMKSSSALYSVASLRAILEEKCVITHMSRHQRGYMILYSCGNAA